MGKDGRRFSNVPERAGEKAVEGPVGNSYKVGLSTEYTLAKGWTGSGSFTAGAGCSTEEYLVASADADTGRGLRLKDDVEVDEAVEKVLDLAAICGGLRYETGWE